MSDPRIAAYAGLLVHRCIGVQPRWQVVVSAQVGARPLVLEDATEGIVTFAECPAVYHGQEVTGAQLRFEGGRVVDATAATNEEFLFEVLDADRGARVLGELGIGCNPGITRYMRNTLFDEKIAGTVHLALGRSYAVTGGVNDSRVHWDMVKDLRRGGELYVDGQVVQRDGAWLEAVV